MRFVVAIVSFVIAFFMIGLGIAQRTLFAEPDRITSAVALETEAPITIIDGATLNAREGRQKIEIGGVGTDTVFAAYGRTNDVIAWAGDTSYNQIGFDQETGELMVEWKKGAEEEAPSAAGSDLWLGEYTREKALEFTVNLPDDISVLVMADGTAPAPANVAVTWPLDNRAPWSGPLIVGGVLILLLGLGMYLWALAHLRKAGGPRRKPPKQPRLPRKPRYNYRKATKAIRRAKPKAIENPRGRRSAGRMTAILPVVLVSAVVLGGCSAQGWPAAPGGIDGQLSVPTPTTMAEEAVIEKPPAVTVNQLEGIMARIAVVAEQADADRDPELAATRFIGAALQLRQANYAIRTVDNSLSALSPIPSGPLELILPQQTDVWPRVVFAVIQDPVQEAAADEVEPGSTTTPVPEGSAADQTAPEVASVPIIPTAIMLVQDTPRDNFKISYVVSLEADIQLPDVASADVGAVRQGPEYTLAAVPPGDIAAAYAEIMTLGPKSEYFEMFDVEKDLLLPSVGIEAKAARVAALSTTELGFATALGVGEPIALATIDAGVIVAVSTAEVETAKPKEAGASLIPAAATKALSNVSKTTKGVSATYGYQLLFYVPPEASGDKIVLLGFSQGLVVAKEL